MSEYVRDEVLAELTDEERRFAVHTSVLDVLTAPLCDELLGAPGSAAVLARLPRAGFPLVPLDRTAERFRHHRLVGEMLRAELHRTDRALEAALHRRASAWHARAGDRERALCHALAADEPARAAELVWSGVPEALERGSSATLEHELGRFTGTQIAADPLLAVTAAGAQLAHGRADVAEHWTLAAAATGGAGRGGRAARGAGARRARRHRRRQRPRDCAAGRRQPRPGALLAAGGSRRSTCEGDLPGARRALEDGARRAAVPAPQIHALCLSQLALIALDEHDSEEAARLSARARGQLARHQFARLADERARARRRGARPGPARSRRGRGRGRPRSPRAAASSLSMSRRGTSSRSSSRSRARPCG